AVAGRGQVGRHAAERVGRAREDGSARRPRHGVVRVRIGDGEVDGAVNGVLFHIGQQEAVGREGAAVGKGAAARVGAVGAVVVVDRDDELAEVVLTLGSRGRLADLLYRGYEETDQDGNDSDDYQQLDQGKSGPSAQHDAEALRARLSDRSSSRQAW